MPGPSPGMTVEKAIMKPYLVSLGIGLLVGVLYAAFKVRSPAPPVIALVGLFGMLLGEQVVPLAMKHLFPQAATNPPDSSSTEG
jgi:XapX domain-containing protein